MSALSQKLTTRLRGEESATSAWQKPSPSRPASRQRRSALAAARDYWGPFMIQGEININKVNETVIKLVETNSEQC
jgi:hypothetical protein